MKTPPSILVVDDDQRNRDMLAEALSESALRSIWPVMAQKP